MDQMANDWYERRDELQSGMVFTTHQGGVVKLDRGVAGDATKWFVIDWVKGYSSPTWGVVVDHWSHADGTIEPGDLNERLPDDYAGALVATTER
jgi:hypothetical protein